jgi:hypothetical protein
MVKSFVGCLGAIGILFLFGQWYYINRGRNQ